MQKNLTFNDILDFILKLSNEQRECTATVLHDNEFYGVVAYDENNGFLCKYDQLDDNHPYLVT